MQDKSFLPFTEEMKKEYTILVPNMLPMHFKLLLSVARTYGYKLELLETSGPEIAATGLKYTHNDALTDKARALIKAKKAFSSVWYRPDIAFNPRRLFYAVASQYRHFEKYRTYCKED